MKPALLDKTDSDLISTLFDAASKKKELTETERALVYTVTATGIIENGGIHYFLEDDFPNHVPHIEVAEQYGLIGMEQAKEVLYSALALFPNGEVIRDLGARNALLSGPEVTAKLDQLDEHLLPLLEGFEHKLGSYLRQNIKADST